ncbi:MAG: DNA recombination protein RmuC [Candidatus Cloacimonetes bacterium]|nr:DNA recombination protein RmuC [Candidatus Cloacimonadota bacterium]
MDYLTIVILIGIILIILLLLFKKKSTTKDDIIKDLINNNFERFEKIFKEDNLNNRMENNNNLSNFKNEINQNLKENRTELNSSNEQFRKTTEDKLSTFSETLKTVSQDILKAQTEIRLETEKKLDKNNIDLTKSFEDLNHKLNNNLNEFAKTQQYNSELYLKKYEEIKTSIENKMESIRKTVDEKLHTIQVENSKKLDEMRITVDQKLQEALDKKLSESFNSVSKHLQDVYKGLGEMKTLANDVGGLKKVLSNVKTRGVIGEIQLGNILESILSPEQYESNVATKANTQERVEFAIKLPGKDSQNSSVYLPIDSKFPDAAYQDLLTAYDDANPEKIASSRKRVEQAIKTAAKDIKDKYINPPETTDFAILFLPFEGLYAEVLQNTNLVHQIQNDYHINITGPTTLGAFINSLQMGFKTLAIEKRSSEVWKLLGTVKFEFNKFGDVLVKAQNKLRSAGDEIDKLVGTRTRKIQSALQNVELLPETEKSLIIDDVEDENDLDI